MALKNWDNPKDPFSPRVTIRTAGTLAFSRGATNKFGFGREIQHVSLAFDADEQLMVIRPAEEGEKSAILFRRHINQFLLWIRNFYDQFDIDYSRPRRFELKKSDRYPGAFEVSLVTEIGQDDGEESETVAAA